MRGASISGIVIAVAMLATAITSAHAITCDDVRSLSREEQEYWSKRLNLTREQRHQILQACYGGKIRGGRAGMRTSTSAE